MLFDTPPNCCAVSSSVHNNVIGFAGSGIAAYYCPGPSSPLTNRSTTRPGELVKTVRSCSTTNDPTASAATVEGGMPRFAATDSRRFIMSGDNRTRKESERLFA